MTDHAISPLDAIDPVALEPHRRFEAADFDVTRLLAAKGTTTVSVCLPARDEAETVGPIVEAIGALRRQGLVDEIVVMDDRSVDATADIAAEAGARVVSVPDVLPEAGTATGKGNVLWASVAASVGDVIVWVDADLRSFSPGYVIGLLGPLLTDPEVTLVKGFYDRPEIDGVGGGRTTELMARPVLATFFPELSVIDQPLGGEYASRRTVLEQLPFPQGYGVETGLLIDIARRWGVDRIAQVDLGERRHRNQPLSALSPQAMEVLYAALVRAGADKATLGRVLIRPDAAPVEVRVDERPPLIEVPGYRDR
ncbi:MAG: glucosyl-3-phosphoglycerate synthase [Actinomycetota bacterium]